MTIDKFQDFHDIGFEGQVAKLSDQHKIRSGCNAGTTDIKFGRFVMRGGKGQAVTNLTSTATADSIVGVSVRSLSTENNASKEAAYKPNSVISYLSDGMIYMKTLEAATRGGKVFVNIQTAEVGTIRSTKDANSIEVNATFAEDAEKDAIVAIYLGDLLG